MAQHLALLQKWITASTLLSRSSPSKLSPCMSGFQPLSLEGKTLTQRGLLVQAGEQSEQIFTRWRLGRITPGRCLGAVLSFWRSCAGVHLAMPAVWEARKRWRCCWVICA
ncbi:MAG: diguanylate cyclase regulator RdcB family protein [Escherichia sp.]